MYNEYFHFSELPFSIAPDPHFMFMSTRHQEGLAHLLYGINHGGGFVALTGEVGTGKTTLCHCLLQQLPENIDIALILNPKLNAIELLATICDELRISYDKNRHTLKNLVDALNQHLLTAHAKGRRTVLVIDEAQNLSLEVLEQVRLLTNLETTKTKLLQIILVGQPELKDLLNRRELRQLNQRITARYHLLPLSLDETRTYIRHRLMVCKGNPDLFKENAIHKIFHYSNGIPRLINIICHCALLGAYSSDARIITPTIIKRAAKETLAFKNDSPSQLKPLLAVLALSCLAAGFYYLKYQANNPIQSQAKTILSGKFPNKPTIKPSASVKNSPAAVKIEHVAEIRPFSTWLDNPALTLNAGLNNALKLWGKEIPANQQVDCQYLQKIGLNCLFDKGNWKDLLMFDRPAVLEFSLSPEIKRYALLTAIKNGQPTLTFDQNVAFPLADLLSFWDGYYVLLWQSPKSDMKMLFPGQSSGNVAWLREQLAVVDGINQEVKYPQFFDTDLKARVINFQRSHHLTQDGKVGSQTIFHLDNATGAQGSPHLKQD
ncbi:AAA family ATPase [Methyloglobulus sp.]|uniref:ExeA family protein n=1 Tax=Methyloglobulus sp. TaxID=2518622 RepID=UPI0032B831E6